MRLLYRLNSKGITLIELLVAMGLSTMLLVTVISGGLFLEKYINRWRNQARFTEELVMVRQSTESLMNNSRRVILSDTSLACTALDASSQQLSWVDGILKLQGKPLLRNGVRVDSLSVTPLALHPEGSLDILSTDDTPARRGLYQIRVTLSEGNEHSWSAAFIVRNIYEVISYDQ